MITRRQFLANSAMAAAALAVKTSLFAQNNESAQQNILQSMRASASSAPIQTVKLTDTVFLLRNTGANILVHAGPDGKLLVDAGIATGAPRLLDTLTKLAPHPLKLLINTSWLFDHTDGNAAMNAAGAFILAQEHTRTRLASQQKLAMFNLDLPPAPASALPQGTFGDRETIYFDNDQIDLVHLPEASSDSDIYVHFVNSNVLHTGELWSNGSYPVIDPGSGGTINGMIQGVDKLLDLVDDRTKIVPSHGAAGNKSALSQYRQMLATVANRVEKLKIAGQTLDQVGAARVTADLDSQWAHGAITPAMFLASVYNTL